MAHRPKVLDTSVSLSALDLFANALGALAFLLLLFATSVTQLARPLALQILTERLPTARVGVEYVGGVAASGGVAPYRWTLPSGELPDGLLVNAERGEIRGTPRAGAAGQIAAVVFEVSDARGRKVQKRLSLEVLAASTVEVPVTREPLTVLTRGPLPVAVVGRPYRLFLAARGGTGRYQWTAPGLPPGLTLQAGTGLLEGVPTTAGTWDLELTVDEGAGTAAAAKAALPVVGTEAGPPTPEIPPPRIHTGNLPATTEADPYNVQLAGTGTPPLHWTVGGLPPGLQVSGDGALSGKPARAGTFLLTLGLVDHRGQAAPEARVLLTVKPRPWAPTSTPQRRRLAAWLGYPLLILAEVAVIFLLRSRLGAETTRLLRLHNVNLITKADGTGALNGPREAVEAVRESYRQALTGYQRQRIISYVLLGIALVLFSVLIWR